MYDTLFTGYQALQLIALGPCLFVIYFFCVCGKKLSQIIAPVLYFLSLAASFALPLQEALETGQQYHPLLQLIESLGPACSFLLIVQFATDRAPPTFYWLVLLVPLFGSGMMIYAESIAPDELCIYNDICATAALFRELYTILSSGLLFLLILFIYHRLEPTIPGTEYQRTHKNALILAIILLNLALVTILLGEGYGLVETDIARIIASIVRIWFVYLVLTSIFRVFDKSLQLAYERIPHLRPSEPDDRERELAAQITRTLEQQKTYRNSGISRSDMAKMFAVSEHQLSRVINRVLNQNFQTLLNHYRVLEAKERLEKEDAAIMDIAFDVGFASIPSFNRVFRQVVGVSPSEYRSLTQP